MPLALRASFRPVARMTGSWYGQVWTGRTRSDVRNVDGGPASRWAPGWRRTSLYTSPMG
jgi:hypothetical protein